MTYGILIYSKEGFSLIYHVGLKGFSKDNKEIAISCYILILKGIYTISPEIKKIIKYISWFLIVQNVPSNMLK